MARDIITGIDPGSSSTRIIVAEQKKDGGLNILSAIQSQSEGIKRGYIINLEDAAKSIRRAVSLAEKNTGISIKKAFISVGGISLDSVRSKGMVMVSRADGEVSDYDVKRAIDQSESNLPNISNKHIIHTIPFSFKIDNVLIPGRPSGMKGSKLEAETLFITGLNQHLSDIIKTVESAKISVEDVAASPLAMSYAVLTTYQKEAGCVLVNIGANTVSIVVFEEGKPISLEVFPIGSMHITNDIALGLQVPLDEAEKLKIDYGAEGITSKRKLSEIIEARLSDIFDLIESHLKKINRNEMLPGGIVLTGGGSSLFNLEDIAKASLRLPAKIGTLSLREKIVKNITASSPGLKEQVINDPSWSIALGLCIMNSEENVPTTRGYGGANLPWLSEITKTLKRWLRSLLP